MTRTNVVLFRDIDQPFVFDIRMYNRPYRLEFYDTASPDNYALLRPDFAVICYAIDDRQSLANASVVWRKEVARNCSQERNDIPVMLLGLKRDLRVEGPAIIYPQEGYRVAQEMRCDRYAECSALTGELTDEVFEDIARTAAKTTTEVGGLSSAPCNVM
ncbi:hypothetical protein MMC29_003051 [Sticta canariensis]|nr:hypothetical protein [Sticta canariensis]